MQFDLVVHGFPLWPQPRLTTQVKPVGHSSPASDEHPFELTSPMPAQKPSPVNVSPQKQLALSWQGKRVAGVVHRDAQRHSPLDR
jgi:hypothetical protein